MVSFEFLPNKDCMKQFYIKLNNTIHMHLTQNILPVRTSTPRPMYWTEEENHMKTQIWSILYLIWTLIASVKCCIVIIYKIQINADLWDKADGKSYDKHSPLEIWNHQCKVFLQHWLPAAWMVNGRNYKLMSTSTYNIVCYLWNT